MNSVVSAHREGAIAVITVDNPPVNALSHAVREGVVREVRSAQEDDTVRAIVLICAGRTFMAGADIREFGQPVKDPWLPKMLEVIDQCPRLTVAAVHGTALGGGLETALACNYRIADAHAKVGLPEVLLGLLPGAGGTQRLPRLAGAQKALDMMLNGKPIGAADALACGIVDRITEGELLAGALTFTNELLKDSAPLRRARDATIDPPPPEVFDNARAHARTRLRGFEAPERIITCVEAAVSKTFDEGMKVERAQFEQCMASSQSGAMRHLFFAERAAGKVPGIDKSTPVRSIGAVGVIGAGTMGAGIALSCMNANLPVIMIDSTKDALKRGRKSIAKLLDKQVERGRLSQALRDSRMELLTTSTDFDSLGDADVVVEAVFENMEVKEEVFKSLDRVCKQGAVLATNTSTLDVDRIARATRRPFDVIGLHFFSPANVMRLLEIVRGSLTGNDVLATSLAFARQVGKLGVVVGNDFGFVGNRMLYGYLRESQLMLLEGAPPQKIDRALTDWGMAMGPNAVGDLAGQDVGYKVRQARADKPSDPRYYRIADMLAEQGRYGQKTGAGMYRYKKGSRSPKPDPAVQAMIHDEAKRLGVAQRQIDDVEIVERCIDALICEGARLLDKGIALRASDIDVIWANGYGFPRYRGGPMHYADEVGLPAIVERVREHARRDRTWWPMPSLLEKLADDNSSFAAWDAAKASTGK
jgi:3-hydroxyacyl-CoA dehydrogenase